MLNYLGNELCYLLQPYHNGTPLTYTMDAGGALEENMDSTMETWAYENLYFYVNADGIDGMTYCNHTPSENLRLRI